MQSKALHGLEITSEVTFRIFFMQCAWLFKDKWFYCIILYTYNLIICILSYLLCFSSRMKHIYLAFVSIFFKSLFSFCFLFRYHLQQILMELQQIHSFKKLMRMDHIPIIQVNNLLKITSISVSLSNIIWNVLKYWKFEISMKYFLLFRVWEPNTDTRLF